MNKEFRIHRGALYQALGFKSGKILLEHCEVRENFAIPTGIRYEKLLDGRYKYHGTGSFVGTVIVRAKVQTGKRDATHRVFVRCPKCSKPVPFGRLHQHVDSKICQA